MEKTRRTTHGAEKASHPRRGEIYLTALDPTLGREIKKTRPALIIQNETGGNLAEILGNLAETVRDRFKIRGEVRVRTAQGRLTAIILISLPPGMLFLMNFLNPDYSSVLFTNFYGNMALLVAAIMQVIGGLILWKIVNIRV